MKRKKVNIGGDKFITLGDAVRDKVTKFNGTATAHCSHLTGCDQILISHEVEKETGKAVPAQWYDVNRIEIVEGVESISLETTEHKGAGETPTPRDTPPV